jgi:hypothetical protein
MHLFAGDGALSLSHRRSLVDCIYRLFDDQDAIHFGFGVCQGHNRAVFTSTATPSSLVNRAHFRIFPTSLDVRPRLHYSATASGAARRNEKPRPDCETDRGRCPS